MTTVTGTTKTSDHRSPCQGLARLLPVAEAIGLSQRQSGYRHSPIRSSLHSGAFALRGIRIRGIRGHSPIRPFAHSRHSPFAAVSFGAVWPGLAPAQSPFAAVARRGRSNCWEAGLPEVDCYSHSATSPRCEADCREVDWSVISLTSLCREHSASLAPPPPALPPPQQQQGDFPHGGA